MIINKLICPYCKKEIPIPKDVSEWIKLGEQNLLNKIVKLKKNEKEVLKNGENARRGKETDDPANSREIN